MTVAFRVLGGVALLLDDVPQAIGGRHPRLLLALLLVARGRPVPAEGLIDRLWPEEPPDTAAKTVQVYVSRLRAQLGDQRDRLATEAGGYRLALEAGELDADQLADEVHRCRDALEAARPGEAIRAADAALARWRGDPFGELADEPPLRRESERLRDLHADAQELRARAQLAAGHAADAVGALRSLVSEQPGRESAWSDLLLALYASGRQAEALETYHEVRRYLDEELGLEPGPVLEAAHLAVLQQTAPVANASPTASVGASPGAGLLGRDEDLDAVLGALLAGVRLVTLTGPGGIGKTTLARAALARIADSDPAPAVFVELESIADPALVPAAVAAALGDPAADPVASIGDARATLVLDNLEQVIDAAAWIAELLAACPRLSILATSRESLRVTGERLVPLGPLAPEAAVELFLARGRLVRPDLASAPEIVAICTELDGLPLAIELAAARVSLLSPAALFTRLDQALDVLGSRRRDGAERQRTLRATIAWSHDLLDEPVRVVFERLGIFAAAFDLTAAEAVAGADLDALDDLLAQSLLTVRYGPGEPAFRLLQTIRAFAADRLASSGERPAVRRAHADWVLRLAETADPSARRSREHVARVAAQLDDCRAVLAWTAAEGEDELRWRLATAMSDVWQTRGHYAEARHWLEDGLEGARLPELLRLDALDDASAMALRQGDWAAVEDLSRSQLDLARRLDRTRQVVGALAKLAQAAIAGGRHEAARAMHAEALALASADADRRPLLVSLTSQANADLLEGRCTEAATAFAQALPIAREVGRPESVATAQFNLGLAWLLAGDPAAARDHLAGALAAYVELDDADGIGYVLVAAAALRAAEDPQAAAVALGASGAALASVGSSLEAVESQLRASTLEALAARLGTALEASVARGAAAAPEAWPAIARDALAAPGVEATG